MLSMNSYHVLFQRFSPNSHQLTYNPTHGDVPKTEEFPRHLLLSNTKQSEATVLSVCLLSCSDATHFTASYQLQEIDPLCYCFPEAIPLQGHRGSP